ncbi:hypothetical protein BSL78_28229 [Apostichopus japonicus]|uniref:Uncharacterized protein n=1 Tax=Stichopus japonicus TaxID=307972 RepID=A0A2G8JGR7_STIJA|nr:hypothetical protein BSL78_28229 [Apostichopus japonicus]
MKHEIVNINEDLWALFDVVDPVDLEKIITKKLPLFEKQWNNTVTNINMAFASNSSRELTEEEVGEPLQSFFAFGNLTKKVTTEQNVRLPYCLFGQHSSSLPKFQETSKPLGFSGMNNSSALHMVCQAVSSKIAISCSRTYFFTSGHTPYPLSGGSVHAPRPPRTDIELLERLYKAVVAVFFHAIDVFSSTTSVQKSKEACLESLVENCAENIIPTGLEILKSKKAYCFFLHGLDMFGSPVSLGENSLPAAGLKLLDIPSIDNPGNIIGSMEFSETFLNSRILVESENGDVAANQRHLILTSRIPRCMAWEMRKDKENIAKTLQSFLHSTFGGVLVDGVSCSALGSKDYGSMTDGTLYVCDEGVLFTDSGNHLVVFPLSYTEEMTLFDGESFNSVSIFCMTYRHSLEQYLPLMYHNQEDVVMFVFPPKTQAYRAFHSEVVSKWQKRKTDPVLKCLEEVPENVSEIYASLKMKYSVNVKGASKVREMQKATANLNNFDRFLTHLKASSVLKTVSIPECDLAKVLVEPVPHTIKETKDNVIVVNLLTGVPGSHQEELCKALVNMAKEQNRDNLRALWWTKEDESFAGCTRIHHRKGCLQYSESSNQDVARHLVLNITCCVDPLNTFLSNRMTFPLLQDQCKRGWVNNVLFTGSTETKSGDLDFCKDLIRKANPDVGFIHAEKGEIRRSTDAESIVSETSFMDVEMIRSRHLSSPGWWKGMDHSSVLHPSFNKVCLSFYQPLERNKFLNNLKTLHMTSGKDNVPGHLYHIRGTTKFTDSDHLTEVYFTTLSGYLSLAAVQNVPIAHPPSTPPSLGVKHSTPPGLRSGSVFQQGASSLLFVGINLEEGSLKAWLRTCAKQSFDDISYMIPA